MLPLRGSEGASHLSERYTLRGRNEGCCKGNVRSPPYGGRIRGHAVGKYWGLAKGSWESGGKHQISEDFPGIPRQKDFVRKDAGLGKVEEKQDTASIIPKSGLKNCWPMRL